MLLSASDFEVGRIFALLTDISKNWILGFFGLVVLTLRFSVLAASSGFSPNTRYLSFFSMGLSPPEEVEAAVAPDDSAVPRTLSPSFDSTEFLPKLPGLGRGLGGPS